jgi:hypothetical protein
LPLNYSSRNPLAWQWRPVWSISLISYSFQDDPQVHVFTAWAQARLDVRALILTSSKGLRKTLPAGLWAELEAVYTGSDLKEMRQSMYRAIALFRQVAEEVGDRLGYAYPEDLHRRCLTYLEGAARLG